MIAVPAGAARSSRGGASSTRHMVVTLWKARFISKTSKIHWGFRWPPERTKPSLLPKSRALRATGAPRVADSAAPRPLRWSDRTRVHPSHDPPPPPNCGSPVPSARTPAPERAVHVRNGPSPPSAGEAPADIGASFVGPRPALFCQRASRSPKWVNSRMFGAEIDLPGMAYVDQWCVTTCRTNCRQ